MDTTKKLMNLVLTTQAKIRIACATPPAPDCAEARELSRQLDWLIQSCAILRSRVEGASEKQQKALDRKIRRALGYTYP